MSHFERFGLRHAPLPRDACGPSFHEGGEGYARLARVFHWLADEPGLGLLVGDAGVGKTAALRHLCAQLPRPQYRVIYLCDSALSPLDVYRALAGELGLRPHHRRGQLWQDLKRSLLHMVDEQGESPVLVLDEAQRLPDTFLAELAAFLNFAFDTRDLVALWLVGLPSLHRRLQMQQHAALATRIIAPCQLLPRLDRAAFVAMIEDAFCLAGATRTLLSEPAMELLFRACRGLPRLASNLLRVALRLADARGQAFLDDAVITAAITDLRIELPTAPVSPAIKPRSQTGTRSRA